MELGPHRPPSRTPSSSEELLYENVQKSCGGSDSYCREHLRKWKSLEGDWRTFKDMEGKQSVYSDDGETTSSDCRLTPDFKFDEGNDDEEWRSASRSSTHEDRLELEVTSDERMHLYDASPPTLRLLRESIERPVWGSDPADLLSTRYDQERPIARRPDSRMGGRYSYESFQLPLQAQNRQEFHDVVNSSYPLLKENFSLLQKLKRERDVCRQLENDMRDLEGHIQDVSKSFELENGEMELRESGDESELGYSSEPAENSPRLSNSFEQIYQEEDFHGDGYQGEATHFIGETDPLIIVENTFSRLLHLAERLESAVRELDMELEEELHRGSFHTYPREWLRMEKTRVLSRLPAELISLLNDLQAALRALLSSKESQQSREQGDRECSSPASFTFHGFSDSRVIVPTVRTIFSPVGTSVEMRPIALNVPDDRDDVEHCKEDETFECFEKESHSVSSESSCQNDLPREIPHNESHAEFSPEAMHESLVRDKERSPNSASEYEQHRQQADEGRVDFSEGSAENPEIYEVKKANLPKKEFDSKDFHQRCASEITYGTNYRASSEIIKRIERLQELVRPELCESLKQRALKIHKAKEEFLSGVSMPNVSEETPLKLTEGTNDIIVEKLSLPYGLTVKEEVEEARGMLPLMDNKKKESWSKEELCRESLIMEDKSDWLRNPFRPKGKYKINK